MNISMYHMITIYIYVCIYHILLDILTRIAYYNFRSDIVLNEGNETTAAPYCSCSTLLE